MNVCFHSKTDDAVRENNLKFIEQLKVILDPRDEVGEDVGLIFDAT
jgi:hypothetical protein